MRCAPRGTALFQERWYKPCGLHMQNEEAEELMRHVEQQEEEAAGSDPEALQLHLCIINLVIGTLYCSKVGA